MESIENNKVLKNLELSAAGTLFRQSDMIILPNDFFTEDIKHQLDCEARVLLQESAEMRDLEMKATANTPRKYRSVGRDAIHARNGVVRKVFENNELLEALSTLAGEPVFRVPYEPEEYIINNQGSTGNTHGWHWDDYAFAMIHVVEAPDPMFGGRVEMIKKIQWDKEDAGTCIREALGGNVVLGMHVSAGQTYFMRTNTTLHRISPLTGPTNRIAIIMSFASETDLHDGHIGHETMEAIYPTDTKVFA